MYKIAFKNYKLLLSVGLSIIIVLMMVGTVKTALIPGDAEREALMVSHTRAIVMNLTSLVGHVTDAETGQRGYLLTGQESYLEPYTTALQLIEQDQEQLQNLLAEDADQLKQLTILHTAIADKLAELKDTIDTRKRAGPEQAVNIVLSGRGKEIMGTIRSKVDEMLKSEQSALQTERAEWHQSLVDTRNIVVIGTGLIYLLIGTICAFFYTEVERRKNLDVAQQAEARRLERIIALQREIAGCHLDLPSAMSIITHRTQDLTRAQGAVVEMLEGDEMVYVAASGSGERHIGLRLKAAGSLSGLCVAENKVLSCEDTENDYRVNREACRTVKVRSMVVVPLRHEKHAIGVLKVMSSNTKMFNKGDIASLSLIAGVLSAAINDAQMAKTMLAENEGLQKENAAMISQYGLTTPDWIKKQAELNHR